MNTSTNHDPQKAK